MRAFPRHKAASARSADIRTNWSSVSRSAAASPAPNVRSSPVASSSNRDKAEPGTTTDSSSSIIVPPSTYDGWVDAERTRGASRTRGMSSDSSASASGTRDAASSRETVGSSSSGVHDANDWTRPGSTATAWAVAVRTSMHLW